jgi:aspartate 1-decarboxylase
MLGERRGSMGRMMRTMIHGKIHRARVTGADLNYVGSITVDQDLLDAAGILPFERVQVVNLDNGKRIETYTLAGERGSGIVQLNGAAAHHFSVGDLVIIMAYAQVPDPVPPDWEPKVVLVDQENRIAEIIGARERISAATE